MKNNSEMSRDERRAAKEAIRVRTQAVIDAYQDSKTAREAVEALATEYGYNEAVQMVATVVNRVGLWDGRIYDGVREWAQSVGAPSHEEMQSLDIYGVDSWIHSAHVNEIGMAMKRYEPTGEEPTEPLFDDFTTQIMSGAEQEEPTEEEKAETEKSDLLELLAASRARIEREPQRSAWSKGVDLYAFELLDTLEEFAEGGYLHAEDLTDRKTRAKAMLNGAQNWKEFSWGGCSLIYDPDIAERLCTPSELKKTRGGERRPNSREDWLDTQARALFQASARVSAAIAQETARRDYMRQKNDRDI